MDNGGLTPDMFIREMTDSSGTIHARYDYDPWGRSTKLSGDLDADFGYTGMYVNKTTGLDLTLFRAYDPEKGRWLSRDPLGMFAKRRLRGSTGPNLYAYVWNNPIRWFDQWGLDAAPGIGGGVGPGGIAGYGPPRANPSPQPLPLPPTPTPGPPSPTPSPTPGPFLSPPFTPTPGNIHIPPLPGEPGWVPEPGEDPDCPGCQPLVPTGNPNFPECEPAL